MKFESGQGLGNHVVLQESSSVKLGTFPPRSHSQYVILPTFKPKPAHALNPNFIRLIATKGFGSQVWNSNGCRCKGSLCALLPLAFGRRPLYESAQCIKCETVQGFYIKVLLCQSPTRPPVWLAFHQKDECDPVDQLTCLVVVSSTLRSMGMPLPVQGL